jgi:Holliday junction resolvase RusA-like endonuclease
MTWKEFKDICKKKGVSNDDELFYIDTGNYPDKERLKITIETKEGRAKEVAIWG